MYKNDGFLHRIVLVRIRCTKNTTPVYYYSNERRFGREFSFFPYLERSRVMGVLKWCRSVNHVCEAGQKIQFLVIQKIRFDSRILLNLFLFFLLLFFSSLSE